MKIFEFKKEQMYKLFPDLEVTGFFTENGINIFIANESNLLHMSISHRKRRPTWPEIKELRYRLLPPEKTFAILLPPIKDYVNIDDNCFHLWELK